MSEAETSRAGSVPQADAEHAVKVSAINRSCRIPLLLLFFGAVFWLFVGSCFGLISSLTFHSPALLADYSWLTYGRVRPAYINCLLYGFSIQAGLAVTLWLFARLGETTLKGGLLTIFGSMFLNLGVLVGVLSILSGSSTGFENLEMPGYASLLFLIGDLLIATTAVLTFQTRRRALFVSHWFLLAALFWFPWIYCTANLLLVAFPVRGVAQAIIAWWYAQNFCDVWLTLVALAWVFYLLPASSKRPLHSRYLALLIFWILILFGSLSVIPASAPVPAWMPSLSNAARIVQLALVIALVLNVVRTLGWSVFELKGSPPMSFVLIAVPAFVGAALMSIGPALWNGNQLLQFTWFSTARFQLQVYGFFVLAALSAIYYIVPQVAGANLPWLKLVKSHFWFAAIGLALSALPWAAAGILQAARMQNPEVPFVSIASGSLMFLRIATTGELLILVGHVFLLLNVSVLIIRLARARLSGVVEVATEDLFAPSGAKT